MLNNMLVKSFCILALSCWAHPLLKAQSKEVFTVTDLAADTRVEVKVKNFNRERYMIACNGVPVPLQSTLTKGEYVAGIRYRAWTPPSVE
jgi:uncharacterized protein (DUF2126 family)